MQCAICTFYETKLDHAQSQIRDYQDACTQKQEIVDSETALRKEAESRLSSCLRTLAFFRSVIQSGESWSAQCQQEYDAARDVEDQYPAD